MHSVDGELTADWIQRNYVIVVDDETVLILYAGSLQQDVLFNAGSTGTNPCLACTQ